MVNKIRTFETFGQHWGLGNLDLFKDFLDQRREEGNVIFTHAHINMGLDRLKICLDDLSDNIEDITTNLLTAATLEECVDVFRAFDNIGAFFAWQIVCDLLELNILQQDEDSWVVLGPGARAGLSRIFSNVTSSQDELHYTKWLTKVLPYCFKALELDFVPFLGKKLSMKHVEHGLCESPDDLVEEISPWVLCAKCGQVEASSFVWEEEDKLKPGRSIKKSSDTRLVN